MVDVGYTEPRLAALYDEFNSGTWDTGFYAGQIGTDPQRVADIGCGTGVFAVRLARAGHRVVGVDPAPAMLAVARARPDGELVQWVEGIASALPDGPFDVAVMTGHAFQCLLTDDEIVETLVAIRERLAPGGRFMFESRNPAAKAWLDWDSDGRWSDATLSTGERIADTWKLLQVGDELVTFEDTTHFYADGAEFVNQSTLRFVPPSRLAQLLGQAGYHDTQWFGNWDGSGFEEESSPEIIVIAG